MILTILTAIYTVLKAHTTVLVYVAIGGVNAWTEPGMSFRQWFFNTVHILANKSAPPGQVVPVTTTTTMAPQVVTQRAAVTPVESGPEQPHVSAPGA